MNRIFRAKEGKNQPRNDSGLGSSGQIAKDAKESDREATIVLKSNFAYVSSAMWFHDSRPSLGSGQTIYPICMLNRTVPGEFLEINQCFLNIHIHRFQQIANAQSVVGAETRGPKRLGVDIIYEPSEPTAAVVE